MSILELDDPARGHHTCGECGTPYWIEIYNDTQPIACQWQWATSTEGDALSAAGWFWPDVYVYDVVQQHDFGFCLLQASGNVPTLGQWGLLGLTALLLGAGAVVIGRRATPSAIV